MTSSDAQVGVVREGADDQQEQQRPSLKRLAVRGSAWVVTGQVAGQVIRLGGNVVLTRLLVPEAFGLMSLVRGVTDGLKMLSDLGIQPAIVQSERADASFLNTAWTMQIIRGVGLFLLGCVLAWPVSKFYGEPVLLALVPAAAVMLLIDGFVATSLYMVQRQLRLAWLTVLETAAQTVNIGVAIALAAVFHTVWALVVGGLVGMGMRLALSHLWLPGIRNRFHWEPEAARKLYHFGKWIFGSTMLTFAAMYADRIILGKLLGMSLLGVYSIAFYLSRAWPDMFTRLVYQVVYPALSRVGREDRRRVREVYYRARLWLDMLAEVPLGGLLVLAPWLVRLLYDPRYESAGWMLQLLVIQSAMACPLAATENCLFSLGYTRYGFFRSLARAVWMFGALPVGYWFWGTPGLVWAVALAEVPVLLVLWPASIRYGLLNPLLELRAVLFLAVGGGLGLAFLQVVRLLG